MPKFARMSDICGEKENHASFSANDSERRMIEETMPPLNEEVTPSKPTPPKKHALFRLNDTENSHIPDNAVRTLADLINSRSDKLERMVDDILIDLKLMNEKLSHEKAGGEKWESGCKMPSSQS